MKFGYCTDTGRVRDRNEDAVFVGVHMFAVADGMGGHKAGEVASMIAVEEIAKVDGTTTSDIPQKISEAISSANKRIIDAAFGENSGMGTTLTLAYIDKGVAFIGHVGDSRAYLINRKEVRRLTVDHSVVGELIRSGFISEDDAKSHPQRNAIIRSLGDVLDVEADIIEVAVKNNDILLLCTDGLHNNIDEDEMREMIMKCDDIQEACDKLVHLANLRGGNDNISVVAVKLEIDKK